MQWIRYITCANVQKSETAGFVKIGGFFVNRRVFETWEQNNYSWWIQHKICNVLAILLVPMYRNQKRRVFCKSAGFWNVGKNHDSWWIQHKVCNVLAILLVPMYRNQKRRTLWKSAGFCNQPKISLIPLDSAQNLQCISYITCTYV